MNITESDLEDIMSLYERFIGRLVVFAAVASNSLISIAALGQSNSDLAEQMVVDLTVSVGFFSMDLFSALILALGVWAVFPLTQMPLFNGRSLEELWLRAIVRLLPISRGETA